MRRVYADHRWTVYFGNQLQLTSSVVLVRWCQRAELGAVVVLMKTPRLIYAMCSCAPLNLHKPNLTFLLSTPCRRVEVENSRIVLCPFLKIRNCEFRFLLLFSEGRNCESKKIPFQFILRFFWPTIPESIPEVGKKQSRNRKCDSFGIGIDTALENSRIREGIFDNSRESR